MSYVRCWPKADIPSCTAHVRFRAKADIKRICLRPATWWRKPMIYRPRLIGSWPLALCKPR